ncbi:MAG: hypothetical protein J0L56_18040 [Chitinophagales bacterium]|nr:hypothetical protein [Chitinophagales bacterium]
MNHVEQNELFPVAQSLRKQGLNYDEIALQLREKGAPENLMQDIIEKLKALRLIQKRNTGFTCCAIGVVLLIAGCLLTLVLFDTGASIKLAMYGLTTLGVIFTFKGLADIMGW